MNGKQLKNSILQWAIQGKLVPQDPNDEPAAVLLQRIREEKARLIKEGKLKKDKNETIIFRGDDNSHYEKFLATDEVKCIDDEIPFEIPDNWTWCRIRDISQSYIGLTYSPTDVSDNGTIVLRSSNIKNGRLDLTDIVRVDKQISNKLQVNINDIIICARNGSKKLVGKSALVKNINEPMTFGAFMAICKTQLYNYIYLFLQTDLFFSQLRKVSDTTTINQLTQNNFNNFLVPIPPLREQQRIVERIEVLLPYIERYDKAQLELDKLNTDIYTLLKKSVLQEAIQGKLVPQDPTDEPATELLKRIQQEKQELVKQGKLKARDITNSTIFKGDDNKYYEQIGGKLTDISDIIPFDIPSNWVWVRHNQLFNISGGTQPPKSNFINEPKEGYIQLYQIRDYGKNPQPVYIPYKKTLKISNEGDILLARYGASLGKVFFAKYGAYNVAIARIIPQYDSELILNNYMYLFYNSTIYQQLIKDRSRSAQAGFNRDDLKDLLFPLPPIKEQQRIVSKYYELLKHIQ